MWCFDKKSETPLQAKRRQTLIQKLNDRFGLNIPMNCKIHDHKTSRQWQGSMRKRWTFDLDNNYLSNIGSTQTVFELSKCNKFQWGQNNEIIGSI
jgi:hypothetical protein